MTRSQAEVHTNAFLSRSTPLESTVSVRHTGASLLHTAASVRHTGASLLHTGASLLHTDASLLHTAASLRHTAASLRHTAASVRHTAASLQCRCYVGEYNCVDFVHLKTYLLFGHNPRMRCTRCRYSKIRMMQDTQGILQRHVACRMMQNTRHVM
jgi:hypothetical protein